MTGHDKKTIIRYLNLHTLPEKTHTPRPIHLVVDATYFGKRTDDSAWGVILFRNADRKENLWWRYVKTETAGSYEEGRRMLESHGYRILSVTCDGFSGNIPAFKGIPLQMCHFHMKQIVIRNVTFRPKTEAAFSIAKFYVALTRARYSVGIVCDYDEGEYIEGITKYRIESIVTSDHAPVIVPA